MSCMLTYEWQPCARPFMTRLLIILTTSLCAKTICIRRNQTRQKVLLGLMEVLACLDTQ